jgi:hypothetical protein
MLKQQSIAEQVEDSIAASSQETSSPGHRGNDRPRKKGQSKFNAILAQDRNL